MQNLRQQLVESGVRLLDEGGISSVTIREVARACGVSHGAPRRHFPTLSALLTSIAKTCVSDLTHRLTATDGDLHASAAAYVSFARSRPHAFDLITQHGLLEDSGQQLRQETVPLLDEWIDLYRSRHPNADKTDALSAWVGVHGIATLESRRAFRVIPADADALLERMLA